MPQDSAVGAVRHDHSELIAIESLLIEHARQHGIPHGWDDALPWIESLITSLKNVPPVLHDVRADLAGRVAEFEGLNGKTAKEYWREKFGR
jgi:hypothetical protein